MNLYDINTSNTMTVLNTATILKKTGNINTWSYKYISFNDILLMLGEIKLFSKLLEVLIQFPLLPK